MYNEVFEGSIDNKTKTDVTNGLSKNNVQVQLTDADINLKTLLTNNLYLTIGVRSYNFRFSNFSKDFTKLLLNGNGPYEDVNLDLTGTEYLSYRYQSVAFGIEKKWANTIFGINASLIKASYLSETEIKKGQLYTHPYGTQIDFSIDYQSHKSIYVESNDFLNIAGLGTNLNLYFAQKTSVGVFSFEIDNLGAIVYDNQESYSADTAIIYRGFDLIEGNNSTIDIGTEINEILDLEPSEKTLTFVLPVTLHVNYSNTFSNDKISLSSGLRYYSSVYNLPHLYTNWSYNFYNKNTKISPSILLSYGGFGAFDWGVGCAAKINNWLFVSAQTISLQQIITPQLSSSFGFNFSTSIRL